MRIRWHLFLVLPVLVSFALFVAPQIAFLRGSLFRNLGYGEIGSTLTFENYRQFLTDAFYLDSLLLTVGLSLATVVVSILVGFPMAYGLARSTSPWRSTWVTLLIASSLVTVVIKALGLMVLLSVNGPVNKALVALNLMDAPIRMLSYNIGVTLGLVHYTLPLVVLVLFSVIQTIPQSLEEAAASLGAGPWRAAWRVVLPLALPGLVAAGLMAFNLAMGTFTSTALLGGGKVLTLPILIERKAILEVNYPVAATISMLLLIAGLLVNVAALAAAQRLQRGIRIEAPA
jgi:putative spermidine/putrescine transport system permease protein